MWLSELIAAPAAFILIFPHRAFEDSHPESPNITSYIYVLYNYFSIIYYNLYFFNV